MSKDKPQPSELDKIQSQALFDSQIRDHLPESLTPEQLKDIENKFMGRPPEYETWSERKKLDYSFQQVEKSMIESFPPIADVQKELDKRTEVLETDGSLGRKSPHLNIKAGKTALVMTNENGKVITFNNQDVLEEYRIAKNVHEKAVSEGKSPEDIAREILEKQGKIAPKKDAIVETKKVLDAREWE